MALEKMEFELKTSEEKLAQNVENRQDTYVELIKNQNEVSLSSDEVCKKWNAINAYKLSIGKPLQNPELNRCAEVAILKNFQPAASLSQKLEK